ncbi:MAG: carbohydrate kinase family protein [Caldimicrobium sp.]|nr:carbohydrate kinase family protein [Caldimicrobium sp.]MCX7874489.1 carbohydrate kinase family protein [Caldimicrobium sp.]MDW8094554.1 carbohydrate kinase family protein [Caldimicrobium sp.]
MAKVIVGCGALNWDIFYLVEDLSKVFFEGLYFEPGKEYVLDRESFLNLLSKLKKEGTLVFEGGGGSSANTIYALAKLSFKTAFLGAVGEDPFGARALRELESIGVCTKRVRRQGETSLALIMLDSKRDRTIVVSPGTAESALFFEREDLFSSSLYHFSSFASPEGVLFQRELLLNLKSKISIDPGEIYSKQGKSFLKPFLEKTQILFITEREFRLGMLSVEEIWSWGVRYLFIKRGKEGALGATNRLFIRSSVYPVKHVVDNTGAGDYFNAGVLAGLSLNLPMDKVVELGLYSASLSLRNYGRSGIMTPQEFEKFLSRLK